MGKRATRLHSKHDVDNDEDKFDSTQVDLALINCLKGSLGEGLTSFTHLLRSGGHRREGTSKGMK
jgi:primase-polymerase (primpol)-like protein